MTDKRVVGSTVSESSLFSVVNSASQLQSLSLKMAATVGPNEELYWGVKVGTKWIGVFVLSRLKFA